jgi:hypothetical protein
MEVQKISRYQYLVISDTSEEQYKVSLTGESKSMIQCTCKGFIFRRTCKHIEAVQALLKKDGKNTRVQAVKEHFDFIEPYKRSLQKIAEEILK